MKTEQYLLENYPAREMKIFEQIFTDAAEKYIEELRKSEQFNH